MTSLTTIAQAAAAVDPGAASALHLVSRLRGRLDALEAAIAGQDLRARLRVLEEIGRLHDELENITYRRAA